MYVLERELTTRAHAPNTTAELEYADAANGANEPATVCFELATRASQGRRFFGPPPLRSSCADKRLGDQQFTRSTAGDFESI